jgi:hypothetical protein
MAAATRRESETGANRDASLGILMRNRALRYYRGGLAWGQPNFSYL